MKIHIFHDWLYKYKRYPARVHAFSTGPGPDWIDRHCYECGKTQVNKHYQDWLDYVELTREVMELERRLYGHVRLHNIVP